MPELDNSPMSLVEYLSVLGPFEIGMTLIILLGIVSLAGLVGDLFVRAWKGEKP